MFRALLSCSEAALQAQALVIRGPTLTTLTSPRVRVSDAQCLTVIGYFRKPAGRVVEFDITMRVSDDTAVTDLSATTVIQGANHFTSQADLPSGSYRVLIEINSVLPYIFVRKLMMDAGGCNTTGLVLFHT